MRKTVKTAVAGLLCGATAITALPAELWAGPMTAANPDSVVLSSPVESVHYRRYRRYYYRYGYDPAGAIFAGAALGLMGAGIAAATRPRYYGWGYPYYGYGWGSYPGYYGWW